MDKGITLGDLQGALNTFVQKLFGKDTRTRLRPSYFPFTEPSVEVDVSCFECGGKGCPLCKHTGWIEVLGGGVVTAGKVLENCNIDPDEYSGFAFGIGIERIAMLKYGINNIGLTFENNLQFLEAVPRIRGERANNESTFQLVKRTCRDRRHRPGIGRTRSSPAALRSRS